MEHWLEEMSIGLAQHGIPSLLCCSEKKEYKDLLFFELGDRTCFIQIDTPKPGRFEFGDAEDQGKLSLGVFSSGFCTNQSFKSAIKTRLEYDKCEKEMFGRLIQNGRAIPVDEIRQKWIIEEEVGGATLHY